MSKFIDQTRPFGKTLGHPNIFFKQDGMDFDSAMKVIPGSLNTGKKRVAAESSDVVLTLPVYADMHIQALKREAKLCYARLDEAGVDYDEVAAGSGLTKRLIGFLNENS